jgi:hypothetical protein
MVVKLEFTSSQITRYKYRYSLISDLSQVRNAARPLEPLQAFKHLMQAQILILLMQGYFTSTLCSVPLPRFISL